MTPETVGLLGGLLFLMIAVVGGGFTIKEIIMPRVPRWVRAASLLVGLTLLAPYFAHELGSRPTVSSTPAGSSSASLTASSGFAGGSSSSGPSTPPGESVVWADNGRRVSPDRIEVSGLLATGKHGNPAAIGDQIKVQFSLHNAGSSAVRFGETFIGARNPDGDNKDFNDDHEGELFAPGATVKISSSIVVDAPGTWEFWPCYILRTPGGESDCPDEWRAFQVSVRQ
jgi:hypothetical protein